MKQKKVEEATQEVFAAIQLCKENDLSYVLPDLYCLVANIGETFMTKEEQLRYHQDAKQLYKIYDNQVMYISLEKYLNAYE